MYGVNEVDAGLQMRKAFEKDSENKYIKFHMQNDFPPRVGRRFPPRVGKDQNHPQPLAARSGRYMLFATDAGQHDVHSRTRRDVDDVGPWAPRVGRSVVYGPVAPRVGRDAGKDDESKAGPVAPRVGRDFEEPSAPRVGRDSQSPFAPRVGRGVQGPVAPRVGRDNSGPFAPRVGRENEGPFAPRVGRENEGTFAPRVGRESLGPFAPRVGREDKSPFAPRVGREKSGPFAPRVGRENLGPFAPRVGDSPSTDTSDIVENNRAFLPRSGKDNFPPGMVATSYAGKDMVGKACSLVLKLLNVRRSPHYALWSKKIAVKKTGEESTKNTKLTAYSRR